SASGRSRPRRCASSSIRAGAASCGASWTTRLLALSKKFRPAEPGETILDIELRRLAAPPAANERLQLSVGLRIRVGVCHRPPAGTPRGVDVVTPDFAVTQ